MPVPVCTTIVSLTTPPNPGCGPGGAPCLPTMAVVTTEGAPLAAPPGEQTEVDFDVAFATSPTTVDGDENIVIGENAVYDVVLNITYASGSGTVTARILVDGISNPELTFVHPLNPLVPSAFTEQVNVQLFAGNVLTVTVEPSIPGEGAFVNFVSLGVDKFCSPATDVIVLQG